MVEQRLAEFGAIVRELPEEDGARLACLCCELAKHCLDCYEAWLARQPRPPIQTTLRRMDLEYKG